MNITEFSIRRPVFITCIMIAIITIGIMSFKKMVVELFPNIDIPVILVYTTYSGAAPSEVENLVTKPLEDGIITIAGIKKISSNSSKDTSIASNR